MKKTKLFTLIFLLLTGFLFSLTNISCVSKKVNPEQKTLESPDQLRVSSVNAHLLETVKGVPVFLNNYTTWQLIKKGTRKDIAEFFAILKAQKFNMISAVLLNSVHNDTLSHSMLAFALDSDGNPKPLEPNITPGSDPLIPGQYDYWDHVNYVIDIAAANGMYISLHPTWGNWVSGGYSGPTPNDYLIFNDEKAYKYGHWLGDRFGNKTNIIWMVGGDRSAIYDVDGESRNFKAIWSAMAEGLADGENGVNDFNGDADYSNTLISFHPRKWAPNSSKWFHNNDWLAFNSIQDTPYDQIVASPHDYNLTPTKPTWLFEGRYEGATSAWAVRYQAYQTVLAGGFGNTYGSENWQFPSGWREIVKLPGVEQMGHLYTVVHEIWTDSQFINRTPDQTLIIGNQGDTKGDGMTIGDGDGGPDAKKKPNATSDRITAMRGKSGKWALIYSANGRDISLDLTKLDTGNMSAYWFNPRNGLWWVNNQEFNKPTPFITELKTGTKIQVFEAPGTPKNGNDWVLVLK